MPSLKQLQRSIDAKRRERDKRIIELRAEGKTLDEIGERVGLSHQRVHRIITKNLEFSSSQ